MSYGTPIRRVRYTGIAIAAAVACGLPIAAATAAPVNLGTAGAFAVLAGSTVTNTGPSVLSGDLGVAPGTALVGFGPPATVNGAVHANDAAAQQAQADLTSAYTTAAGQPVPPANDLTGQNLGDRTLTTGVYGYSTSAGLTGALTLDAQGDPNATFLFRIGSTLTTAAASSVVLINGASACNVFWQIGSSATLGATTAFKGTIMALADVTLDNAAAVTGRLLARNGEVTLINNAVDASGCASSTTPGATPPGAVAPGTTTGTTGGGTTTGTGNAGGPPGAGGSGTSEIRRTPRQRCTSGFRATVRGRRIARVIFSIDGRHLSTRTRGPYTVFVRARPGRHIVKARVTYTDATPVRILSLRYRACAAAVRNPRPGRSPFTG